MIGVCTLAFLGDIGGGELLVVFAAILLLFGGKQLPPIARSIGKMAENLKRTSQDFRDQLMNADRDPEPGASSDAPPHPGPGASGSDKQASPGEPGNQPDIPGKDSHERAG